MFISRNYPLYLLVLVLLALSCNDKEETKLARQTPLLKDQIEVAVDLWEEGDTMSAHAYLDSLYSNYPDVTVADKYEYYYFFSDRYSRYGMDELSEAYIDSMLQIIEDANLTHIMKPRYAQANYFKGDRLLNRGAYQKAFEYYYIAQTIAKESADTCALAYYNYKTAWVSYRSERYSNAINFFKTAFKQFGSCTGDFAFFYRKQQILDNIGLSFYNLEMADSAIHYYDSAVRYIESNKGRYPDPKKQLQCDMAKAVIWGNTGSAYLLKGMYVEAESLFKKSIDLNVRPNFDIGDALLTKIKLGMLYFRQGKVDAGLALAKEVDAALDTVNHATVELRWNSMMWHYYSMVNKESLAYDHLLRATRLEDSLDKVDKLTHPADMDERISIIEHTYQLEALEEKEQMQEFYLLVALVISGLCIVIAVLVVLYWRKSRKNVAVLLKLNERSKNQQKDLKLALDELEELGHEKDRILKAVSHDMRSPINSSLALVDLLTADEDSLNAEQKEYLSLIKTSNENALNLTKDLLELATLNTEKLVKDNTDITILIDDRVKLLSFKAAEKQQKLVLNAPENHITAYVNAEKISRVVNNLITNAIKFSPMNSAIDVTLNKEGKYFMIIVADKGIGIPEHMQSKVFDLFSEAKRFGTSGEQPFGLGLSISKQIIEAHDGKIWLESTEGHGTTFYVEIPIGI